MEYKIVFHSRAVLDIDAAMDYYREISETVMYKFYESLHKSFKHLQANPFYQIRYDEIRCLPMRKFPYLIHFTLDEHAKEILI